MEDKILQMFFEHERWIYAIEKGCVKGIRKNELYQLTKPEVRVNMYNAVKNGQYEIAPPHTALIPKDTPGEFRTVYVNEPIDRIFLSIANDLLFDLMPDAIHPRCKSYQKGIGCGKVVKEISHIVCTTSGEFKGWKADFSKYFDSVPIEFIDKAFDDVERVHGHSAVIDVLRKYFELFSQGKRTLKARRDLLATEREHLQARLNEMQDTLARLDYKISVYDEALASKDKELKF